MKPRIVTIEFEVETSLPIKALRELRLTGGRGVWSCDGYYKVKNVEKPKVNVIRATKPESKRK